VWANLWEFEFSVVGVHGPDLLPGRCPQHLDDLN
jgi:hypothetical protein